jgi:hypothetical protein
VIYINNVHAIRSLLFFGPVGLKFNVFKRETKKIEINYKLENQFMISIKDMFLEFTNGINAIIKLYDDHITINSNIGFTFEKPSRFVGIKENVSKYYAKNFFYKIQISKT